MLGSGKDGKAVVAGVLSILNGNRRGEYGTDWSKARGYGSRDVILMSSFLSN